jgi:methyl-accepting chemotaxis protein
VAKICAEVVARLREIEERGKPLNEAVATIASTAGEQRANIERVSLSVSEMNQVTQGIAAHAEESASASSELSAQSEHLTGTIEDLSALIGAYATEA